MNKNKYYRVREKQDNSGKIIYSVEAYENKYDLIFGFPIEYSQENKTLDDAIDQVNFLAGYKIKKIKTVFKRTVK